MELASALWTPRHDTSASTATDHLHGISTRLPDTMFEFTLDGRDESEVEQVQYRTASCDVKMDLVARAILFRLTESNRRKPNQKIAVKRIKNQDVS